jgi:hypothetical protein
MRAHGRYVGSCSTIEIGKLGFAVLLNPSLEDMRDTRVEGVLFNGSKLSSFAFGMDLRSVDHVLKRAVAQPYENRVLTYEYGFQHPVFCL